MCGIFTFINNAEYITKNIEYIEKQFNRGSKRGPENSILKKIDKNILLGFHRLAINGLNNISNQPIQIDNITLICNGEVFNYKQIHTLLNIAPKTDSDCECIIHLYLKYGIEYTLRMLDGVYAFVLLDNNKKKIYIARDLYGVRPLYCLKQYSKITSQSSYLYASEIKSISNIQSAFNKKFQSLFNFNKKIYNITSFTPGTYSEMIIKNGEWNINIENKYYMYMPFTSTLQPYDPLPTILLNIRKFLCKAVHKRVYSCERKIAALLSGGLDSSLIAALVNRQLYYHSKTKLETYAIGLPESEDLKYAKMVADYIGSNHHEIIVSEDDFFNAIPEVIYAIESYDTTTVRASVGNYLIAKYIKENSESKVIFGGDGADELMGGYLYFHKAPSSIEFDNECKRLINDISYYDVLRCDKTVASNGLEARCPFLDRELVQYYLSLDMGLRCHNIDKNCEKYLLRKAFDYEFDMYEGDHVEKKLLIPKEILYRQKEAFSDGVSKHSRSWYNIIQEKVENITDEEFMKKYKLKNMPTSDRRHNPPTTKEQIYYRNLFDMYFENCERVIPYFWMPKYCDAKDASARSLDIYNI
jgi:asparagine synthase (glutamine-hydrolysing)